MKIIYLYLLLLTPCFGDTVLVSIAPHQFLVEEIAGDTVNVQVMVPAGASAHTFEPTPKQVLKTSHANLWFLIGEPFEERAAKALTSHNPTMQLIDLQQGLDLIGHSSCCIGSADVHTWLSPRLLKKQAETITKTLSTHYPEHKETYNKNFETLGGKLDALDQEISTLMAPLKQRTILVSHPAYAYFARDYQLEQLPIEHHGKDPSPKQLTKIIQRAHNKHITYIYLQEQHNTKGARLIAQQIGAIIIVLDPYEKNSMENLLFIAQAFARQG